MHVLPIGVIKNSNNIIITVYSQPTFRLSSVSITYLSGFVYCIILLCLSLLFGLFVLHLIAK